MYQARAILTLLVAISVSPAASKKVSGQVDSEKNWMFLDKFCFDATGSESGAVSGTFTTTTSGQQIAFYDDQKMSWEDVYGSSMSCAEKATHARWISEVIPVESTAIRGDLTFQVTVNEGVRPRWWWVVVMNCGPGSTAASKVDLAYEIEFVNAGGFWDRQYSWNDQGLAQMYLAAFITSCVALGAHLWSFHDMRVSSGQIHPIVRTLSSIVACFTMSTGFKMVHWVTYGFNGEGIPAFDTIGALASICTQMMIILLSIFIAKGWTVSTPTLEGHRYLWALFASLMVSYILCFIWYDAIKDPTTNDYIYDSGPGILIVFVRLAAFGWFCWELYATMLTENIEAKRTFYYRFGFAIFIWMLSFPLYVAIAARETDWWKEKVMLYLTTLTNLICVVGLIVLFWPKWVAANFQLQPERPDIINANTGTSYDSI